MTESARAELLTQLRAAHDELMRVTELHQDILDERRRLTLLARESGASLTEIGEALCVKRERARQLLNAHPPKARSEQSLIGQLGPSRPEAPAPSPPAAPGDSS